MVHKDISKFDNFCTFKTIKNDCNSYLKLFQSNRNPVFSMCIMPYLALMCIEIQNAINVELFESPYNTIFSDMRNSLKRFIDRYGKTSKTFSKADEIQDAHFSGLLHFKALSKLNIHLNLGIYFDESGNVIGNTQHLASIFDFNNIPGNDEKEKSYNLGYELGRVISFVFNILKGSFPDNDDLILNQMHPIYYLDLNTNKNDTFWNNQYDKDVRLYILHIISFIGFINNTLSTLLPYDNLWLFRLRYISCYYCICGLNKLCLHVNDNVVRNIKTLIDESNTIFNSRFRGCMMHYSFTDADGFCIKKRYFDRDIPLFGLVESCFFGKSFDKYNTELISLSEKIENLLKNQFNIDKNRLQLL